MTEAEIYLDMDGVCVDFLGAALTANGFASEDCFRQWREKHPGELFPEALLKMNPMEFFTHETLSTKEFWAGLVPFDWFERLYSELDRLGHVIFLTAPISAPGCVHGKHEWLINQFGSEFHEFIFTRHKNRLAHPNAYLVDDMPFNTEPFEARNGVGLLFPQIWNEHHNVQSPVDHIIDRLERSVS